MTGRPVFACLVREHGDELLAHARVLAGADAEDVLQDALLRALRAYPQLEHTRSLRAWLYRIVTTAAADHHRRRHPVPTADLTPDEHDHVDVDGFEEAISPATAQQQVVLRLRYVDDLSHAQIAAHLHCSVPAARQRLRHALTTLRSHHAAL